MTEMNNEDVKRLLQAALPPIDPETQRDLWPQMLQRIDRHEVSMPWLDWVLLVGVGAFIAFVPASIPLLLYQL